MTKLLIILCTIVLNLRSSAQTTPRFKAVAFDYFVIFDPNSIVPVVEKAFPGKGLDFTKAWRSKQFEYCFLRSITNRHTDFYTVTGNSLDYTARSMHLVLTKETRERLMSAYLRLKPWPDAIDALHKLKLSGLRIIALTNFSPEMIKDNASAAGIADLFDLLLSTEENHTFKPDTLAYNLGLEKLGLSKQQIVFAAFGGWDAYGAKNFGYPTYWINRFDLPVEELDAAPDSSSNDLKGLLEFVLRKN